MYIVTIEGILQFTKKTEDKNTEMLHTTIILFLFLDS